MLLKLKLGQLLDTEMCEVVSRSVNSISVMATDGYDAYRERSIDLGYQAAFPRVDSASPQR